MRIKLKTLMSGPDGSHQPGTELDVDAKQGKALIEGNYADEIKPPRRRAETAVVTAPENTAQTQAEQDALAAQDKIAAAEAQAAADAANAQREQDIAAVRDYIAELDAELAEATDETRPGIEETLAAAREELQRLEAAVAPE